MPKNTSFLVSIAAALGFSTVVANAADIAPAAYDWTGFYVGVNAGVAWNNTEIENDFNSIDGVAPKPEKVSEARSMGSDLTGDNAVFTGGAMVGYNWQYDSLVLGVETDISYLGFGDDEEVDGEISSYCPACTYSHKLSFEADWFGTLRGRLGFAVDNLLFYGTGGIAYGHMEASSDVELTDLYDQRTSWKGLADDVNWGWTVGAGMEFGIDNLSFGLEYLFVDLGDANWDANTADSSAFAEFVTEGSVDYQFSVVRATAKLRF